MLLKKCLRLSILLLFFFSLTECSGLNNKNSKKPEDEDEDEDKELNNGQAHCPEEAFEQMCLQGNYMRQRPPNPLKRGGTEVNVSLLINSLTSIDSIENVIGMELSLLLAWRDPRVEWKTFPRNPGASWILLTDLMRFGSLSFPIFHIFFTCQTPLHTRPLLSAPDLVHDPELDVQRRDIQPGQLWHCGRCGSSLHIQDPADAGVELRHGVLPLPLRHPGLPGLAGQHEGAGDEQDERQVENPTSRMDREANQHLVLNFFYIVKLLRLLSKG